MRYIPEKTVLYSADDNLIEGELLSNKIPQESSSSIRLAGSWYSGGTGETTKPQLLVEPEGSTSDSWSVFGTGLGINASDGFTGNLVDFQINGASKFRVSSLGSYQDSIHLNDLSGNNYIRIKSPDVLPNSVTWNLPSTDGQTDYVLVTDGNGNLRFVKPSGGAVGGGNDFVFLENDNTVTTDYTLGTNKNAVSAGPVTINSGVTVTIPSGQSWVIV